jgi:hypothetical protein
MPATTFTQRGGPGKQYRQRLRRHFDDGARLVRRFGIEAPFVLATARAVSGLPDQELVSTPRGVTLAELIFGVTPMPFSWVRCPVVRRRDSGRRGQPSRWARLRISFRLPGPLRISFCVPYQT